MIAYTTQTFEFNGKQFLLTVPQEDVLKDWYEQNKDAHPFPYWGKVWPAAKALSQFIITNHELVAGKKVMEIAAGLGLPSISAASFAKEVLITEAIPMALQFISVSIELNALKNAEAKIYNWNEQHTIDDCEVMLMSDVNYNPADFPRLLFFIETQLKKGIAILLSTPQRLIAKTFIEPLVPYIKMQKEFLTEDENTTCSVFVLRGDF
jgi:predicted nicotinamide N-methyase